MKGRVSALSLRGLAFYPSPERTLSQAKGPSLGRDSQYLFYDKNAMRKTLSFSFLSRLNEKNSEAAAAAGAPNISYCASIDLGDAFPAVIQLGMRIACSDEDSCYQPDALLDTLRFLATQGRFFPNSLANGSLDEFSHYLSENADAIFNEIESDIKGYLAEYESAVPSCPYCGSGEVELGKEPCREFHCRGCDALFDDEDIQRQKLRDMLSPMLSETSEEKPFRFRVSIKDPNLELDGKTVVAAFLFYDGTMWFLVDGEGDFRDVDELSVPALESVVKTVRDS